jgi:hypothetical protein
MNSQKIKYADVIAQLDASRDSIIESFKKRNDSIDLYFYITDTFRHNKSISANKEFREKYKSFYVMRAAGLTDEHFDKYFELLDKKESILKTILEALYVIKTRKNLHSLQFSFATKLLHTLDNNQPIFDQYIRKTLGLRQPYNYLDGKDQRIRALHSYYEDLKDIYQKLLAHVSIKNLIGIIRTEFDWPGSKITDAKILDFILWVQR